MKKVLPFFVLSIILFSCKKDLSKPLVVPGDEPEQHVSKQHLNQYIKDQLEQKGYFDWKDAGDEMVWSALQNSDSIIAVGYKPAGESELDKMLHTIDINNVKWMAAKQQVLRIIYDEEKKINSAIKMENLEVWQEKKLPVINVKIQSIKTLKLLRQSTLVRYAEPMGYDPIEEFDNNAAARSSSGLFGGSGCGDYSGDNNLVAGRDYMMVQPNAKVSWNYSYHGIQNAWTKSSGAGVKIMVIDTGVSPDQDNFSSGFNQGLSYSRTIEKIVTLPNEASADDGCGHGTTMSGTVAAPRGTDGNSCGIAYNSNLVICRATRDVFIDGSSEVKGISDAYVWAADNSSVKITSMSLGRLTNSGQIKDAIQYAYGKGKLMFCAGGTSFSLAALLVGVIFPASLGEVQAITGVKDKSSLTACNDCHKGKQIDYVIVMEKQDGGLHGISTAVSGDVPTTVGGSSVSAAVAAGIAALAWSRFPSYTREQLVNKLTVTASGYPDKSSKFGWGKLNADAATN